MQFLPPDVQVLVQGLIAAGYPVWLFGSRANGTSTSASDWDLLVFGNEQLLNELVEARPIENVDLMVVYDGDAFKSPWSRDAEGAVKSGSLSTWSWSETSSVEATYSGTKWPDDWGSSKTAKRLLP